MTRFGLSAAMAELVRLASNVTASRQPSFITCIIVLRLILLGRAIQRFRGREDRGGCPSISESRRSPCAKSDLAALPHVARDNTSLASADYALSRSKNGGCWLT